MKRFALWGCFALTLIGCPREVPRDAGPPMMDAGRDETDAGEVAANDFDSPMSFNDDALRYVDPSALRAGSAPCREPILVRVAYVVDGDTIHGSGVSGAFDAQVRLIGIDTPEIAHDGMPADCYGPEAQTFTDQLDGHLVWLTFDNECFDRFGRVLAYVHVGPDEGGFWQRQLLRRGFATEFHVGSNLAFEGTFQTDEAAALADRAGLWGACP